MSKPAVVLAAILVLAILPLAQATPPSGVGTISIKAGAIKGLVKEDGKDVVPYAGNVTVPVTVTFDCSLLAYEFAAAQGNDIDHFHVQAADDPKPTWLVADELITHFTPVAAGTPAFPVPECAMGTGTYTQTVDFPFGVTSAAPALVPLLVNVTANLHDDAFAAPASIPIQVQFHPVYTVTPSIQFPYKVTGSQANFTVTVRSASNGMATVMFHNTAASMGTVKGLDDTMLNPGQSMTLPVTFTAPSGCWSTATVNSAPDIHPMVGSKNGAAMSPGSLSWTFTHDSCTAKSTATGAPASKKSPTTSALVMAGLALALLARRRRA